MCNSLNVFLFYSGKATRRQSYICLGNATVAHSWRLHAWSFVYTKRRLVYGVVRLQYFLVLGTAFSGSRPSQGDYGSWERQR